MRYSANGQEKSGIRDDTTSLRVIMSKQPDFLTEKTVLQKLWERRGHELDKSPKCHPECAGEGHEYCFGKLKRDFRHHGPATRKLGLRERIDAVLKNSLPIERCWRFARKTWDYRQAYIAIGQGKSIAEFPEIQKIVKARKAHRSCLDTNFKFCG